MDALTLHLDLLGPLVVTRGGSAVELGPVKRRLLLACLLLRPNEVVPAAELAEALWGGSPPASAAANLRTYVLGLRRALGAGERIEATPGGYLLRVAAAERDVDRFDAAAERGRRALAAGDPHAALPELAAAVDAWRGAPLADLPVPPSLAHLVGQLEERRALAEEDHAAALLATGAPDAAVPRMRALVDRHPLRERAWSQLMTGLYHTGDVAGALDAFRRARAVLAEETGLDPGPELTRLHEEILRHGDVPGAPPATGGGASPGWHELPPRVTPFVGRWAETDTVSTWLKDGANPVVALHGPPGVGKSALAVRVAHLLTDRYPAGALYVDLQGADGELAPLRPLDALGRFLRALGVPGGQVPVEAGEASALYRRLVSGRGVLVVLDNARSAAQVGPLLPTDPTCGALVTSRLHLATLPGARHLGVELFSPEDAVALLGGDGADPRVAAEPQAAHRLAELCGHLPLALRVTAARLASRPTWPLAAFAERLADPEQRLDALAYDDLGVRPALQVGYAALAGGSEHERRSARAFRLIGSVRAPEVTLGLAAALVGEPPDEAVRLLDTLADHRLLEAWRPDSYRLHDLLRLYALDRARAEESTEEREAALRRLVESYLAAVQRAEQLVNAGWAPVPGAEPPPPWQSLPATPEQADRWLGAERHNLTEVFAQAGGAGGDLPALAARLAWASYAPYSRSGYPTEARVLIDGATELTGRLGMTTEHGAALFYRSRLRGSAGDVTGARADLLACAEVTGAAGDELRLSACYDGLGNLYYRMGEPVTALEYHEQGLALRRALDKPLHVAASLSNMAQARLDAGRPEEAMAGVHEALRIAREIGATGLEGAALSMRGQLECRAGDVGSAVASLTAAVETATANADHPNRCEAHLARCAAHLAGGRWEPARQDADQAQRLATRIGDRYLAAVALLARARADAGAGRPASTEAAGEALGRLPGCRSPMYEHFFGRP